MFHKNVPVWMRWTLLLPGAIGAYLVVQVIVAMALTLSFVQHLSPSLSDKAGQFINSAVGPYFFVIVGAGIAPTRKRLSAVLLALGITLTMMLVYALSIKIGVERMGYGIATLSTSLIIGIASCITACVQASKENG